MAITTLATTLSASASASASEPKTEHGIWGGEPAEVCALPTVAWLPEPGCSAVLIGPELVLTAAHCTQSLTPPTVVFGEDASAPALVRETIACVPNPAWTGLVDASDFGYCRLAEPVALPIVPVARGCELDALAPGGAVVLAGFGEDEQGLSGRKRWVETELSALDAGLLTLGGGGDDSCFGDSGGPVLFEREGEWRIVGLIIGGDTCGAGGLAARADDALIHAELDTGLDLDPCRAADGTWAPSATCGDFASAPLEPAGQWSSACASGPLSGAAASCGPAFEPGTEPGGCGCSTSPTDPRGPLRDPTWPVLALLLAFLCKGIVRGCPTLSTSRSSSARPPSASPWTYPSKTNSARPSRR
ncbi:Trypsin-like protease precursor [Enhygromyxa salina]|uniref:Trypsin-like protease n=1 Tax=Enhygromyxa salina TaxID=215803 RepID=A0A2S9XIV6_9BACT|nr:Trypsin-like protease precursor [Enhygromyxa salina]